MQINPMVKVSKRRLFALAFALLALSACEAAPAPVTAQAAVLDTQRLEAVAAALQDEVDRGVRAGFVAGIVTRDGETYATAIGMADIENGAPMRVDTRFRIASMTKPIVTAAMMQLADRGVVKLSDPVARYVPAFANARVATSEEPDETGAIPTRPPARAITIRDLLNHTAGIGYVFDSASALDRMYLEANLFETEGSLAERIEGIARIPLYADPGTEWRYSYATDVAGLVIEAASGLPLETYLKRNIFEPLGMRDTEFFYDATDLDRAAALHGFAEDGALRKLQDDAPGGQYNKGGYGVISGGAGLISTVRDYLRFCEMMLREGELDGKRVLSRASVRQMMSDILPPEATARLWERDYASFALGGTVVTNPGAAGGVAALGEWSWTGLWDTWFVINPVDGVAVVLLAQTQPGPHVPPSQARAIVKQIAYGAVRR